MNLFKLVPFWGKDEENEQERRVNAEHRKLCDQAAKFDEALEDILTALKETEKKVAK